MGTLTPLLLTRQYSEHEDHAVSAVPLGEGKWHLACIDHRVGMGIFLEENDTPTT